MVRQPGAGKVPADGDGAVCDLPIWAGSGEERPRSDHGVSATCQITAEGATVPAFLAGILAGCAGCAVGQLLTAAELIRRASLKSAIRVNTIQFRATMCTLR